MEADTSSPGRDQARNALHSIVVASRRLAVTAPPEWVHWSAAVCMVIAGLAQLLVGWERMVAQVLVLVAIFALGFAAPRSSGVVPRLTRLPARALAVWIGFIAIMVGWVSSRTQPRMRDTARWGSSRSRW